MESHTASVFEYFLLSSLFLTKMRQKVGGNTFFILSFLGMEKYFEMELFFNYSNDTGIGWRHVVHMHESYSTQGDL